MRMLQTSGGEDGIAEDGREGTQADRDYEESTDDNDWIPNQP